MIKITGRRVIYGVHDLKPIVNAPEGRQRVRLRAGEFAHIFIRTAHGLRAFYLEPTPDRRAWQPMMDLEIGRNVK